MQLSSSSSSSGIGASKDSAGLPPTSSVDPNNKDVASAFGSVIFEPGTRPAAAKGTGPSRTSINSPIDEGEEEGGAGVCGEAAVTDPDDDAASPYGSPVDAGMPPGDDAGADSRPGSAPSVPPLSPQVTPGVGRESAILSLHNLDAVA